MIKDNKKAKKMPVKGKKKNKKGKIGSAKLLMGAVVLTAVVIILAVMIFSADKVLTDDSSSSESSELLSAVSADEMGFPVTFSNNDIIKVDAFSSDIFVLGKKILTCISDKGKVRYNRIFTFTNPYMTVSDKYGLVYDRGSSRYFIFNNNGVIYEGETENKKHIITAKINNRGDVALVTKSDDSACRVTLTDKKGKVLYIWACAEEYGVSIDLSADSREILCGAIGSENGTVYSMIYLLETFSDEAAQGNRIDDSTVVDVCLVGKKGIVTCNNSRTVFTFRNSGTTKESINYSSDLQSFYTDENGNTAAVSHKVGSFETKEITVHNKNNDVVYVGYTDEKIADILCRGKKAYLLTDKAILEASSDGVFEATGSEEISGEGMVVCKNRFYYYSTGYVDINS